MDNLRNILRFGQSYLHRYAGRLVAGILFGVVFGLCNGTFVWATKVMIGRVAPAHTVSAPNPSPHPPPEPASGTSPRMTSEASATPATAPGWLSRVKLRVERATDGVLDPWLPRLGRAMDWRQVLGGLLFLPFLVAFRGVSGYLSSYCLAWVSERVVNDLRIDVVRKLSALSLDYFDRSKLGDLITRVNGDAQWLQKCLSEGVSDLVKEPVTLIGLLLALLVVDWQLTLVALLFVPLCLVPIAILGRKVRQASRKGWTTTVTQSGLLVEVLSGIRIVKAFGLETLQLDRFREMSRQVVRHTMKAVQAREQLNPIIESVSVVALGLLILYVVHSERRLDDVVAFLTGLIFIYTPVKKLARLHVLFEQTRVCVDRLAQVLAEQPSVQEPAAPQPLTAFQQGITFRNVSFAYAENPVLQELDLDVPRGLKLGVAGESGSGKSTLVNLLFRFYDPRAGEIRIDGRNLREVASADLRRLMALVSQEVVLFDLSVAENIALGRPGASRAEIEVAARSAHAHEFITRLPQGYDTVIGERGATLSVGQRQRLAIARAFVRNAPILVLDEATAALDAQSEAEVQAALDSLAAQRTVVCVAHRLITLRGMDRIIVLSRGRIVEQGTFAGLLARPGTFAAMARRQGIASLESA